MKMTGQIQMNNDNNDYDKNNIISLLQGICIGISISIIMVILFK